MNRKLESRKQTCDRPTRQVSRNAGVQGRGPFCPHLQEVSQGAQLPLPRSSEPVPKDEPHPNPLGGGNVVVCPDRKATGQRAPSFLEYG